MPRCHQMWCNAVSIDCQSLYSFPHVAPGSGRPFQYVHGIDHLMSCWYTRLEVFAIVISVIIFDTLSPSSWHHLFSCEAFRCYDIFVHIMKSAVVLFIVCKIKASTVSNMEKSSFLGGRYTTLNTFFPVRNAKISISGAIMENCCSTSQLCYNNTITATSLSFAVKIKVIKLKQPHVTWTMSEAASTHPFLLIGQK